MSKEEAKRLLMSTLDGLNLTDKAGQYPPDGDWVINTTDNEIEIYQNDADETPAFVFELV